MFTELAGLDVTINDVVYMPNLNAPEDKPHPFVYYITISNDSEEIVTIRGRKWIVTEENGETVVVEGDGVVGQFPCLKTGERFTYNSYHVLARSGRAEGTFFGSTEEGENVMTRIPSFEMIVPKNS